MAIESILKSQINEALNNKYKGFLFFSIENKEENEEQIEKEVNELKKNKDIKNIFNNLEDIDIFKKLFEKHIIKKLSFISKEDLNFCVVVFCDISNIYLLEEILEEKPFYYTLERKGNEYELFLEVKYLNRILEEFFENIN